jgi:hypothetical protein
MLAVLLYRCVPAGVEVQDRLSIRSTPVKQPMLHLNKLLHARVQGSGSYLVAWPQLGEACHLVGALGAAWGVAWAGASRPCQSHQGGQGEAGHP